MVAILDLVNKAWTYVAELYFIGFVDPQGLVTGHGGHFEKRIFLLFGHF